MKHHDALCLAAMVIFDADIEAGGLSPALANALCARFKALGVELPLPERQTVWARIKARPGSEEAQRVEYARYVAAKLWNLYRFGRLDAFDQFFETINQ